jgi:CHAT domain-containing protein
VVKLLGPELPSALAQSDLAVRRHITRAIALSRLPGGASASPSDELQLAEQLCRKSSCALDGEIARAHGVLAVEQDNAAEAQKFFQQSLDIAKRRGDRFLQASALSNLVLIGFGLERYDDSIDWSNQALQVSESLGTGQITEQVIGNLGWAYYKMGDFETSLAQFQEAEKKAHELGSTIDRVEWLNNIGLVYAQLGQLSVAENYYRESLELAKATANQKQIIDVSTALALVLVQQGHLDQARQYSEDALARAKSAADHPAELYLLLVEGETAARSQDFDSAEKLFRTVATDADSDAWLRWQSRDDLARLYEGQGRIPQADRQYREARDALKQARELIRREEFKLPFQANAVHLYDDFIHFLVQHGRTDEALREADDGRAQTLAEGLRVLPGASTKPLQAVDPQALARRTGATILFYWLGQGESYLWAASSRKTVLAKLPGREEIEAAVRRYREALVGSQDVVRTANAEGRRLYDILVAPVEAMVPKNSHVIIIPDRSLNNLNFETLLAPSPRPHFWIEDVTVSNASSLRMLAASSNPQNLAGGKLLLIGDPVVPDPRFPALPNAQVEMADVERHFPTAREKLYAREQATPSAYLESKPERFAYIHFVAHGTASRTSPLDSAVVLSQNPGGQDSFKLHARDIIGRPLHAELVTISACYGSGKAYTGEGLVGLSWAFLRAGAHNVIGALWEVSDASTPQLMDRLYSELKKGRPPEDALRSAKLSLIHSEGAFRKPFYWAPFQIYAGS